MDTRDTDTRPVIVVGIDFSPESDVALREALRLVRRELRTDLHLVHALHEREGGMTEATRIEGRERLLADLPAHLRSLAEREARALGLDAPPGTFGVHVRIGPPARAIVQLTVDVGATLVVVGTHGRGGVGRLVLGSVAETLVRSARCPVLVVRPTSYDGLKTSDALEPPCSACVDKRLASSGAVWWCDVHGRPHVPTHVYSATQVGTGWAAPDGDVTLGATR